LSRKQSKLGYRGNTGNWGVERTWRREWLRRESVSARRVGGGTRKASGKGGGSWYPAGRGGGGGGTRKAGRVWAPGAAGAG
jgi:hypothetical protein